MILYGIIMDTCLWFPWFFKSVGSWIHPTLIMTEGNTPLFSGVSYERTNEMMNTLLEFLRTCWPALLATALAAYLLGERQLRDYCDPAAGQNRHPGAWEREMPERRMCCAHRESCPRC